MNSIYEKAKKYNKIIIHTAWGVCDERIDNNRFDFELLKCLPKEDYSIIELPSDFTDIMIIDYDGKETVYIVVNGKIKQMNTITY